MKWIVVSRPRTGNDRQDWQKAAFLGPFDDEATASQFAQERDQGKEGTQLSLTFKLIAPGTDERPFR
jgi:hypothetical protein